MLDELDRPDLTASQFLDDLRYNKGYTSIITQFTDEYIKDHDRTLFYDGDVLEYQVGTNRIVKAYVDGSAFEVRKDGVVYKGDEARALFKNDKEFKVWKRTADGEKNALISDACAKITAYHINYVYALKELVLPKDLTFCSVQELMWFVLSRDFESMLARHLPVKEQ